MVHKLHGVFHATVSTSIQVLENDKGPHDISVITAEIPRDICASPAVKYWSARIIREFLWKYNERATKCDRGDCTPFRMIYVLYYTAGLTHKSDT